MNDLKEEFIKWNKDVFSDLCKILYKVKFVLRYDMANTIRPAKRLPAYLKAKLKK